MHTFYLPTGQRSRLKEAIQMQINSDINNNNKHLYSAKSTNSS